LINNFLNFPELEARVDGGIGSNFELLSVLRENENIFKVKHSHLQSNLVEKQLSEVNNLHIFLHNNI